MDLLAGTEGILRWGDTASLGFGLRGERLRDRKGMTTSGNNIRDGVRRVDDFVGESRSRRLKVGVRVVVLAAVVTARGLAVFEGVAWNFGGAIDFDFDDSAGGGSSDHSSDSSRFSRSFSVVAAGSAGRSLGTRRGDELAPLWLSERLEYGGVRS